MISFKQLCEWSTSESHHNFYFSISLLKYLTEDELKLVHIKYIDGSVAHKYNPDLCILWYPISKWLEHEAYIKAYEERLDKQLVESAQEKLWTLDNEIFPEDLPSMKELTARRVSASLKDDYAAVKQIDKLITLRCRKDERDNNS